MHDMEHSPDGHVSPSRRPEQSALQRDSSKHIEDQVRGDLDFSAQLRWIIHWQYAA